MTFDKLELKVHEPDGIHGWGIEFDSKKGDSDLTFAYNLAISHICLDEGRRTNSNCGAFHQSGRGNEPGYHYWELLAKVPCDGIGNLFPLIHQRAKHTYETLRNIGGGK